MRNVVCLMPKMIELQSPAKPARVRGIDEDDVLI